MSKVTIVCLESCRPAPSKPVQVMGNILPVGIVALDQVHLPLPGPFLDGLFTGYGGGEQIVLFEPDQHLDAVAGGKARCEFVLMVEQPAGKIAGNTRIQCAIALGCEDVDIALHEMA